MPLLLFDTTYYPPATPGPVFATTLVYGRVLNPDGSPAPRVVLQVAPDLPTRVAPGAQHGIALATRACTVTTAADGSFSFPVANTGAALGFQVACRVSGPGIQYRFVIMPGFAFWCLPGAPLVAPPTWSSPTTCAVSGTISTPTGQALSTLSVEYPTGRNPLLVDGSIVRQDPLAVAVASDGSFTTPLLYSSLFSLPNVRALVKSSGLTLYFATPSATTARLEDHARLG